MKILLSLLLFGTIYSQAQQSSILPYKHNRDISDDMGFPKDSLSHYFPLETFNDSFHYFVYHDPMSGLLITENAAADCNVSKESISKKQRIPITDISDEYKIEVDTLELNWFSYAIFKMDEPILYNNFLGKEIYRFTWLRSFHRPVIISLINNGTDISISTKELERNTDEPIMDSHSGKLLIPNNNIPFVINKTKRLNKRKYDEFIELLDSLKLFSLPHLAPIGCHFFTDGAKWILETQKPDGYNYIIRQSPENGFPLRQVGEFLINLSEVKNEEIY